MSDAPSLDALARLAAELLAAATPGPWDAGALNVYAPHDCRRHMAGGSLLAQERCACRVIVRDASDKDRPLIAAAPDLARGLVAAVDALRAERDRRDALAAAVQSWRTADAHRASVGREAQGRRNPPGWAPRYAAARKAWVDAKAHLDALLSGAAPDVVRAGVVRAYLTAEERWREGSGVYLPGEDVTAYVARREAERVRVNELHKAMVAALAAAEGR